MTREELKNLIQEAVPGKELYFTFRHDMVRVALGYVDRIDDLPVYDVEVEAEITNLLQLLGFQYKVKNCMNQGNKYIRIDVQWKEL